MRLTIAFLLVLLLASVAAAADFRCDGVLQPGVLLFEAASAHVIADHFTVVNYGAPLRVPAGTVGMLVDQGSRFGTLAVCWSVAIRVPTRALPDLLAAELVFEDNVPLGSITSPRIAR